MKLTVTKAALIRGLQLVVPVTSTKNTLPVLNNILIDATDLDNKGLIKLSTNDLEMGIECYVAAQIEEKGAITVPAKRFNDIVKELADGNIIVSEENTQVQIKAGKSKFNMVGISAREFPVMVVQDEKELVKYTLDADKLAGMLTKISFSVTKDAQKYVLTGVLFDFIEGTLNLVTTDGRRMSYVKTDIIKKEPENIESVQAIVPIKAVTDIIRLIGATSKTKDTIKEVVLQHGDNVLTVTVDDITFQTKLIDGIYPRYGQVIPKKQSNTTEIKLPTTQVLQAIKQVSLLAGETGPSIVMAFSANTLIISAKSDKGEAKTEISIDYLGETKFEIAFNPILVKEVLQNIDGGEFIFAVTSSQSPIKITIEGQDYLYIVMPMKR